MSIVLDLCREFQNRQECLYHFSSFDLDEKPGLRKFPAFAGAEDGVGLSERSTFGDESGR